MRVDTLRRLPRLLVIAVLVLVGAAAVATTASARPTWEKVLRDCAEDGRLDRHYSRGNLENALRHMPPDIARYTDCKSVIRAALNKLRRKHREPGYHRHRHRHYHDEPTTRPRPGPRLYATGEPPASATVFTMSGPSGASGADRTIDGAAKTSWTTRASGRGVMVTPNARDYAAIGVVTTTPGWTLEVYWSNAASPRGPTSGDWQQAVLIGPMGRRSKLSIPDARHYLVWVSDTGGKRVRINEIQLIP